MHDAAALAEPDSPASTPEAASPLLDRQLRMLGELAEIGLEMARALASQAKGAGPKVTEGDLALAYGRVARAVRQAILLQSRLVDESKARAAKAEKALVEAREDRAEARRSRISFIVERVAEAQHDDEETVDGLCEEADHRIDDDGLMGDVLSRPVSETVALICRALDLDPDWTRLAQEAWAQEELASGEVGWPLEQLRTARPPPPAGVSGDRIRSPETAQWAGGGIPPPLRSEPPS